MRKRAPDNKGIVSTSADYPPAAALLLSSPSTALAITPDTRSAAFTGSAAR